MINLSGSLESKIAHGVWVGGMILVSLIVRVTLSYYRCLSAQVCDRG